MERSSFSKLPTSLRYALESVALKRFRQSARGGAGRRLPRRLHCRGRGTSFVGNNMSATSLHSTMPLPWKNPRVLSSVASGLLLLSAFLGDQLALFTPTPLYVVSVIIGGFYFGREAIEELVKEWEIGIELLMVTAAIVAGFMGQWAEAATLVFLYSISEAAEGYTSERTRYAVRALMDLVPKTALVRRNDEDVRVSAESLHVGDIIVVRPGEAIPTDGEVTEGHSSVSQAPVTGESIPVEKIVGSPVFAGTLNGEGAILVRATKTAADNTIARIVELVEQAQTTRGRSQRFIERFGRRYSPAVLGLGVLIALVPAMAGLPWQDWLMRSTVFIVAAAPCALVISIPITLVAAIGTAGRNGILIKGGVHLENLAKVRVVALDKTGTLTMGRPVVTDLIPFHGISAERLIAQAAALEARSQHPLARAILEYAQAQEIRFTPAEDFRAVTGAGTEGLVEGKRLYIGHPRFFAEKGLQMPAGVDKQIEVLQGQGKTVIIVATDEAPNGLFAIADPLRPEAAELVSGLKKAGIHRVVMLTGDNLMAARAIAAQAGIDEVHAELRPEEKATKVAELEREYGKVAMVGDGVNDAPALAAAHVGIAMGAIGTDVALETADVALMADDLSRLIYLIRFSKRTWRVIQQNLLLSAVVIGVLVIGSVAGSFSLPVAVLAHEISEFIVIASGLRMLRA
jgi:heavy metal translocating P-type ATPase